MNPLQVGDHYRCVEPLTVTVWLAIAAPVTIMGDDVLPAGEALEITDLKVYGKVCCRPLNYDALHEHFVPKKERDEVNRAYFNRYEGYSLLIAADTILNHCQSVTP